MTTGTANLRESIQIYFSSSSSFWHWTATLLEHCLSYFEVQPFGRKSYKSVCRLRCAVKCGDNTLLNTIRYYSNQMKLFCVCVCVELTAAADLIFKVKNQKNDWFIFFTFTGVLVTMLLLLSFSNSVNTVFHFLVVLGKNCLKSGEVWFSFIFCHRQFITATIKWYLFTAVQFNHRLPVCVCVCSDCNHWLWAFVLKSPAPDSGSSFVDLAVEKPLVPPFHLDDRELQFLRAVQRNCTVFSFSFPVIFRLVLPFPPFRLSLFNLLYLYLNFI